MLDIKMDSIIPDEISDVWANYKGLIIGGLVLLVVTFMIIMKVVSS